jgi:hypothetical protein
MVRSGVLLLGTFLASATAPTPNASVMSVCELSKDFARFRDKVVTVRGVYYYGLRQECIEKCEVGLWPSFINLEGGTDEAWTAVAKADVSGAIEGSHLRRVKHEPWTAQSVSRDTSTVTA